MVKTFISQNDLHSSIRDERLEHILHNHDPNSPDPFTQAALEAQSIVSDFLCDYDMVLAYSKEGNERNRSLLFYLKHICLYSLYERIEDEEVPSRVIANYDDTIKTLKEISMGKLKINLSKKKIDTDGDGEPDTEKSRVRWGGKRKTRFN